MLLVPIIISVLVLVISWRFYGSSADVALVGMIPMWMCYIAIAVIDSYGMGIEIV